MNELINFGIGQPSADMLRPALLAAAAADCFAGLDPEALNYGDYPGDAGAREALANFLARHYGSPVGPDELFLTAGASQAIDLACRVFCRAGDVVLVEEPSYFLALDIFASHGLRVVSVPMDSEGMRVDALADALAAHAPSLIYTIPLHHNPTAVCMSTERRREVLAVAREHGVPLLADEVYQLLQFEHAGAAPAPFARQASEGGVLSVGSFSKILAPAMRVGWIQTSPDILARLCADGMIRSGGAINHLGALIARSVLRTGAQDAHLERVRHALATRATTMHEALVRHMPEGVRWQQPAGGYFFWLTLPQGRNAEALLGAAREAGVAYHPGSRFSSAGEQGQCLRLSFARYGEETIGAGIERLGAVLSRAFGG